MFVQKHWKIHCGKITAQPNTSWVKFDILIQTVKLGRQIQNCKEKSAECQEI